MKMTGTEWVGRVNNWLEKPIRFPFSAPRPDEDNQTFLVLTQDRRRKFLPAARTLRTAGNFRDRSASPFCGRSQHFRCRPARSPSRASMLVLCCLVSTASLMRRRWEKDVERQLQKLTEYHDRLVREVARSRGDVSTLKEGLYDTAASIQNKRRA